MYTETTDLSKSGASRSEALALAIAQWQKAPTKNGSAEVLRLIDPLVRQNLRKYGLHSDPQMSNFAKLYALRVLKRYNPKFSAVQTFLNSELQRLQRVSSSQVRTIPMSERGYLEMSSIEQSESGLKESLGRDPTQDELAEEVGLSHKRIVQLRRQYKPQIYMSATEGATRETEDPSDEFDFKESVWTDAVYSGLDPVNKKIFEWTTEYRGAPKLPKNEIAKRLHLSPAAITQRAQKIADVWQEQPSA